MTCNVSDQYIVCRLRCGGVYIEVLGVNVAMLGHIVVLLGHEHALAEEVLVDLLTVGLGDKPVRKILDTIF
jgi:hypothetical protein